MPFPIVALIGVAPQIIKAVGSLFSKKGRKEINPKVKTGALTSAIVAGTLVGMRQLGAPVDEYWPDIQNASIVVAGFVAAWIKSAEK